MKNIGKIDKIVRYLVAIVAILAGYTQVNVPWNYALYGVGIFAIATALVSTCPTWLLLGVSTKKHK